MQSHSHGPAGFLSQDRLPAWLTNSTLGLVDYCSTLWRGGGLDVIGFDWSQLDFLIWQCRMLCSAQQWLLLWTDPKFRGPEWRSDYQLRSTSVDSTVSVHRLRRCQHPTLNTQHSLSYTCLFFILHLAAIKTALLMRAKLQLFLRTSSRHVRVWRYSSLYS